MSLQRELEKQGLSKGPETELIETLKFEDSAVSWTVSTRGTEEETPSNVKGDCGDKQS